MERAVKCVIHYLPWTGSLRLMIPLLLAMLCGCQGEKPQVARGSPYPQGPPWPEVSGTFSIVAVDPNTGVCGAAVASKYPAVGKVVPYVRAGVGAFCTQHWHNPAWGERALDLLADGKA